MAEYLHEIDIRSLRKSFPVTGGESFSDSFFITKMDFNENMQFMEEPCRFNGYLAFFCLGGEFTMEINLKSINVRTNSLIICIPGTICRVTEADKKKLENLKVGVVAVSREMMSSIRFDFNSLFNESIAAIDNPCITLNDDTLEICRRYFNLALDLFQYELPGTKDAIRYLMSSVFYFLGAIWTDQIRVAKQTGTRKSPRSSVLFDNFLKLVSEYHSSERKVSFYADKLCVTPKYLSKLIKNVSGRSAPEWIDSFVILEAKNMLKYSDMPIKEVVYQLHFPNQSVFYKFFKAHTGMTPSEYRNSK